MSVVMPFAGDRAVARDAVDALRALDTGPDDQLILADNSSSGQAVDVAAPLAAEAHVVSGPGHTIVTVAQASGERSPAHARNAGAARARNDWILFLDADCRAPHGLLDAYFAEPVSSDVGALAGEVVPAADGRTLAARYAATKSFLSQGAHLAHPYLPRAVAANLLVRRAAFEQVGGFYEGVRAGEDTDLSWRLQQAGWKLELRRDAQVEHRYRATLGELRRQWRGYAAGRAWLARRYDGFVPEPAVQRSLARTWHRMRPSHHRTVPREDQVPAPGRLERGGYLALDALLAAEELAGLGLSNRPRRERAMRTGDTRVVLIAEHFPSRGDPLVDFVRTLDSARVEAAARPESIDLDVARSLRVDYREDDGAGARAIALASLVARHPVRCATDLIRRRPGVPPLAALASATTRLAREPDARVHALGGDDVRETARRLAALTGRQLDEARERGSAGARRRERA